MIQEPVLLPRDGQQAGKNSSGAGRRSPHQVHLASVEVAPTPAAPEAADRAALEVPWRHFLELDGLVPHPSVYSPRQWREYRATLVRREELGRCGATADQVRPLDARLSTLENSLRSERFLLRLPESSQNNMVMNVVQGGVIDPRLSDQPAYLRFWSPPRGIDPSSIWNELTQAEPPAGAEPLQPLRCRIDDFLIRQAEADPFHNLATAAARLNQTRGTDYPQPAEAHFLIMLQKQLERPPNQRHPSFWPRVSQALRCAAGGTCHSWTGRRGAG